MTDNNKNILEQIDERDVKFIKLQFIDIFGGLKNISITSGQIGKALQGKFMIDGFHIPGMHDLGHDRLFLQPDPSTFAILPWRPQQGKVARFLCDITDEKGRLIAESPRTILKNVLADATDKGYCFDIDPDCEFFLFKRDENGAATVFTEEKAGYLDAAPMDKGENARRELILSLEDMGFKIQSSRHELASGQHSVIFKQSAGMRLADQIVTFRATIRTVAERHGLHATFMPKPRTDLPGSSMRMSVCIYKDGNNIFEDSEDTAMHFIAGILRHQRGITAFSNPVINSYKRLKARFYAPSESYWSKTDHFAPVRYTLNAAGESCIEWKLPDGAADPYTTIAVMIASGMQGISEKLTPPVEDTGREPLPTTLIEALHELREDSFLMNTLGESFANTYIQEKEKEWERYSREVTDWELNEYLERI